MNLRNLFSALILSAIMLTVVSCDKGLGGGGSDDAALAHIPSDVSSVSAININRLMEKADFEAVKQMEFFQEAVRKAREENPAIAEIMLDPAKSGINLQQNAYMSYDLDPNDPEKVFAGFSVSLSDKAAFEAMLAKAGLSDIADKGNHKHIVENNMIIAWNDEFALIGGSNDSPLLWQGAAKYFNTDKKNSIADNKNLRKVLSDKHDMVSWMTSNAFSDNDMAKMALGMANIPPEALKDNFIHGYADFEDGEFVSRSEYHLNKELTKDLDLFFKDKVKTDFSPYVKGEGLQAAMTAALDIKGIKQVLNERPQFKAMGEFAVKEYGTSLEEIVKIFDGDLLLSVYRNGSSNSEGLFVTAINDMNGIQKLLNKAVEGKIIRKIDEDNYVIGNTDLLADMMSLKTNNREAYITLKDGKLFVTGDAAMLETIKNGGLPKSERLEKAQLRNLSGNIFSGFFDFRNMVENFTGADANLLRNMEISTNRKSGTFKMKMKDENANSLKQIFEMINENYKKNERGEYGDQGKETI